MRILGAALLLLLLFWAGWCYLAFKNVSDEKSRVVLERYDWYEVLADGKPVLYFSDLRDDSLLLDITTHRDSAMVRTTAQAVWVNRFSLFPLCGGRIRANIDSLVEASPRVPQVLKNYITRTKQCIDDCDVMADEMEYYFSVHDVQDEGFELVTDYYTRNSAATAYFERIRNQLERIDSADSVKIQHRAFYLARYHNEKVGLIQDTCAFDGRYFRLLSRRTPKGVKAVSGLQDSLLIRPVRTVKFVAPASALDGFGLKVTPEKGVQVGYWEKGKYKGEQLEHNSQRIYGIDISRFQHEKGKKRYSIQWDKLRITSLGTLSKKKISGEVDYPVSFVYIKATEGTTVKNKYYSADYAQSRKHGYRTGNYHFFSTKSSGAQQAKWYLKNSYYKSGDLPPVLDIEPSTAQIRAMGGAEKMFKEVRAWLNAVKAATGVQPILYISQSFVNKYLPLAPDLKKNYQVWIARYGEYRPDVHMLYWQLSPDGHVRGIAPEVDINVFNGYQNKYDDFVNKLR